MEELDLVVLNQDISKHKLTRGDVGVVVHRYTNKKAYEVEFLTGGAGRTLAVLTLKESAVRPFRESEILHVRPVTYAHL